MGLDNSEADNASKSTPALPPATSPIAGAEEPRGSPTQDGPSGLAALLKLQEKTASATTFAPINRPESQASKRSRTSPSRESPVKPWVLANLVRKRAAVQRVHQEREARRTKKEQTLRKKLSDERRARRERSLEEKREAKRVREWEAAQRKKDRFVKKAVAKATKAAKKKAAAELEKWKLKMKQHEVDEVKYTYTEVTKQIDREVAGAQQDKELMDHRMKMTANCSTQHEKRRQKAIEDESYTTKQFFHFEHSFGSDVDPALKPSPETPPHPSEASSFHVTTKKQLAQETKQKAQRLAAFEQSVAIGKDLAKRQQDNQEANRQRITRVHEVDLQQTTNQLRSTMDGMKKYAMDKVGTRQQAELRKEEERLARVAEWEISQAHQLALDAAILQEEADREKANKKAKRVATSRKAKKTAKDWEFFETSMKMATKELKDRTKDEERRQNLANERKDNWRKLREDQRQKKEAQEAEEERIAAKVERDRQKAVRQYWSEQDQIRAKMLDLNEPNNAKSFKVNTARAEKRKKEEEESKRFAAMCLKREEDMLTYFRGEEGRLIEKWKVSIKERDKSMKRHLANKKRKDDERLAFLKAEGKKRAIAAAAVNAKKAADFAALKKQKEIALQAEKKKRDDSELKKAQMQREQREIMQRRIRESEQKFAVQREQREKEREDLKIKMQAQIDRVNEQQKIRMLNRKPYELPAEIKKKIAKNKVPFESPYEALKTRPKAQSEYKHYVSNRPTTR